MSENGLENHPIEKLKPAGFETITGWECLVARKGFSLRVVVKQWSDMEREAKANAFKGPGYTTFEALLTRTAAYDAAAGEYIDRPLIGNAEACRTSLLKAFDATKAFAFTAKGEHGGPILGRIADDLHEDAKELQKVAGGLEWSGNNWLSEVPEAQRNILTEVGAVAKLTINGGVESE